MRLLPILMGLVGMGAAVDVAIEWGLLPVGPNFSDAVTADNEGNVYSCSHLYKPTTLGGEIPLVTPYGNEDWFITKQLPDGTFVWGNHFGGTFEDSCFAVAVNKAGTALYVAGVFKSSTFRAGPYTVQHTNGTSSQANNRADAAIVKVDTATGAPLWVIGMGSSVADTRGLGVAVDSDDNVVLTGNYRAPMTIPGLPVLQPFTFGFNNGFVAKFSSAGTPLWRTGWGSDTTANGVGALSVEVDPFTHRIYVGGFNYATSFTFAGKVVVNNGPAGTGDVTIVVFSKDGNELWAKSVGGSNTDDTGFINVIAIDARRKAIYIATTTYSASINNAPITSTNPFSAGDSTQLIFKVDFEGNGIWTRFFGNAGGYDSAQGIGVDKFGNVYFSGMCFNNGVTYDSIQVTGSGGDGWAPVVSLSATGAVRWAGSMVGVWGYDMHTAPSGFVLPWGSGDFIRWNGTSGAFFNPGPGTTEALFSKIVFSDPYPYGPLTLSGVIAPGNRDEVVVRQGKKLSVTYTLTRPADKAASRVARKDLEWANYTLEVELSAHISSIKSPRMTPMSKGTTQKAVGTTLFWENVPMPVNGNMAYKRRFKFLATVDPRYTGPLVFDAMAYNDEALALKKLTANIVSRADYPQAIKDAKQPKAPKVPKVVKPNTFVFASQSVHTEPKVPKVPRKGPVAELNM